MAQHQFPRLMKLGSKKQRLFVLNYAAQGFENAVKAAKEAGYTGANSANQLLKTPAVVLAIEEQQGKVAEELEEEFGPLRKRVIHEQAELAFRETNSIAHLATWTPQEVYLRSSEELGDAIKGTIRKIKRGQHGVELEAYDRGANLERLGRMLGLGRDNEVPGQVELVIHSPKSSS